MSTLLQCDSSCTITILVVAFSALLWVILHGLNLRARWRLRHIPGPRPAWLKGNLSALGIPVRSHDTLCKWYRQYGPVYRMFLGTTPIVVVTDPDIIKDMGTQLFTKFYNRPPSAIRFSHGEQYAFTEGGILMLRGKEWAGVRAACDPMFQPAALKTYTPLMHSAVDRLEAKLARQQGPLHAGSTIGAMTMEVIGGTAFGVDIDAQGEERSEIVGHSQVIFAPAAGTGLKPAGSRKGRASKRPGRQQPRWLPQLNARQLMVLFPSCMGLIYRIGVLLKQGALFRLTEARGYVVGTSQVLLRNARAAEGLRVRSKAKATQGDTGAALRHSGSSSSSCGGSRVAPTLLSSGSSADELTPGCGSSRRGSSSSELGQCRPPAAEAPADCRACLPPGPPAERWSGEHPGADQSKPEPEAAVSPALRRRPLHPDGWLLRDAEQLYERSKARGMKNYVDQVPQQHSLFSQLMHATNRETGERLTELQICSQVFTILLAGYETTATSICYTLYELARNPDVRARLIAEVDAWGRDREPGADDLGAFPYTTAVFKESLRRHTIVTPLYALAREAGQDVVLGGHHIPRGTRVWLNVRGMHLDEQHFPDPLAFKPERHFDDSPIGPSSRHPNAWAPFGIGPRKCLGFRFAMQEAVLTLVRLHQRFTFDLDPARHPPGSNLRYLSSITLMPRDGIWLTVRQRI